MTLTQMLQAALDHHKAGRWPQAQQLYRQIVQQNPRHFDALHLMGQLAHQMRHDQEALELLRQAIAVDPRVPEAQQNLAIVCRSMGRLEEAESACQEAIRLQPDCAGAYCNLGNIHRDARRLEEAIAAYRQAIARNADLPDAHSNLGAALYEQGQYDAAVAALQRAIVLKGDYAGPHWNLAIILLLRGQFAHGWEEFEWRWGCPDFLPLKREFLQPQWKGGDVAGQRILLRAEQGMGDTIQFVRYAPLLAARGAQVIVTCAPTLKGLVQSVAGVSQVVVGNEALPAFDLHVPMLSLPLGFATTLQTIPDQVPYLQADAEQTRAWAQRLEANSPALKVGVAWAGNPRHRNDHNRSLPAGALAPLRRVGGVTFYSLQKRAPGGAALSAPGVAMVDWTEQLNDFAATAALIANLDLVITVDTAVAHLAGALGKPVWTLLPFVPDWRWLLDREDSPWYPTMRLFRQQALGQWGGTVARVARELGALAQRMRQA